MLDTVTLREAWPLKRALPAGRRVALDNKVNIWPDHTGQAIRKVEFSAATVLHGHNGRLIENQEQIGVAMTMVAKSLATAAHITDPCEWHPSRLDLVWNFDIPARPVIMAHGPLLVPGIRNGATSFKGGEGISWRGAKSHLW